jgi:hypothetical protein
MDIAKFLAYLAAQNYTRSVDEDFAWFITDSFIEGKSWKYVTAWLRI